jgi:hypothetical protein
MYILYTTEIKFNVGIIILILKAFTSCFVCHGIDLQNKHIIILFTVLYSKKGAVVVVNVW